jgi:hypothetical protein
MLWIRVLPEAGSFSLCPILGIAIAGLDFGCRFTNIFFVHPAKTLFEQFKASVLTIDKDSGNYIVRTRAAADWAISMMFGSTGAKRLPPRDANGPEVVAANSTSTVQFSALCNCILQN